ncbi:hypothetical protein V494_01675 [Pseudogymnoascus sp. VKM F-4513 (FW-928)]|nr:hypothetical protein V494_01675 [Pseudogymnoascus sp. VKM F-4513 (FW-928)]
MFFKVGNRNRSRRPVIAPRRLDASAVLLYLARRVDAAPAVLGQQPGREGDGTRCSEGELAEDSQGAGRGNGHSE